MFDVVFLLAGVKFHNERVLGNALARFAEISDLQLATDGRSDELGRAQGAQFAARIDSEVEIAARYSRGG